MFRKIMFIFGVLAISLTLAGCDTENECPVVEDECPLVEDDCPDPIVCPNLDEVCPTAAEICPVVAFDDELFQEVLEALESRHYTEPSRELLIEGAIEGMINILDDPFTTYFDSSEAASYIAGYGETYVGIGVVVQFLDELVVIQSVMDGGPADTAGLRANDIIVEVDGINLIGMAFYEIIGYVIGDEGTNVNIGVVRNGIDGILTFSMTRAVISNPTVEYTSYLVDGELIGYIKVNTFGDLTASLFHAAIVDLESDGIDSLIIDLRVNGGGYLTAVLNMLSELLVDDGVEMFATESYYDGDITRTEYFGQLSTAKTYDIVTLVNGNSASASEVFASAMQEHGGYTVVGVTTFGKGTMQTDMSLTASVGDSLHITIGKWFTSDGNWVHYDGGTDGVVPDVIQELNEYEKAYKVFLLNDEVIMYDTVDDRTANVQLVLNIMGYSVRTDGYYDTSTRNAVMAIQTNNLLTVTGNLDSDTLEIINEALNIYQNDSDNDSQLQAAIDYLTGN
ncbi:MAG: Carboxy-terminal processing protease CtpB precursor [Candidatus Izimaplasma bacterium HR2]|nr:MAG: Carboxy-terminal processing protease CtpB precursor [Candidatus Izimaplasma bacterium HR2]